MSTSGNNALNSSFVLNRSTLQDQNPEDAASIYLLFHGLMCFAYNSTTRLCEVGMHSKAPEHDFKIFAFQLDPESPILPPPVYSFEPESHNDVPGGVVTVEIEEPITPGVHYHYPDDEDEYTWNQLLDLEGSEFYGRKLKKTKNVLKPQITINHGLFFVIPTTKSFRRIDENTSNGTDIGPIGYFGVSTVTHNGTGTITLKIHREKIILQGSIARPLLIVFANACPADECSLNESDFPLYYKAFKIKSSEKKYRLEAISHFQRERNVSSLSFFANLFQQEPLHSILSNNDAPCGVAGYGRSSGINDSIV